ncbi:putative toxin-antitoxin system toxin component, PIN family [Rudaea sp.]|uniref:putative toxin-antitoxin system toxin component, PIN family n=1 Tax=Rudaea sp. TaxID=2136325 RepID=UPI0037834C08
MPFQSNAGASCQLLRDALERRHELLLSVPMLLEYEAVLTRSKHLAEAGITEHDVIDVPDEIAGSCVPVVFDCRWQPSGADTDDELVVETAINGQANTIATFNTRHMQHACRGFGGLAERPALCLKRIRTRATSPVFRCTFPPSWRTKRATPRRRGVRRRCSSVPARQQAAPG